VQSSTAVACLLLHTAADRQAPTDNIGHPSKATKLHFKLLVLLANAAGVAGAAVCCFLQQG
jgi:hypothetical protein